MSDAIVEMHTLKCDYPGCDERASDDSYVAMSDYDGAVEQFADFEDIWYHDWDTDKDYCPKHREELTS